MGEESQTWLQREIADQKVPINAMEEGYVCELLPHSMMIT